MILRRDVIDGGDQDYVVLFSRPADVRNTVFLVKKHVASDDDRWLYLPGLDLVRRIAAGDKRTSFVGIALPLRGRVGPPDSPRTDTSWSRPPPRTT
jgi:hypothetical protein